jgi:subtilisin family serine protease
LNLRAGSAATLIATLLVAHLPAHATARRETRTPVAASELGSVGLADRVPGQVVVRYRPSTELARRNDVLGALRARLVSRRPMDRTDVLAVGRGEVDDAIATLEASPDVLFAEPNFIYRASAIPNDPRFGSAWGLDNTGQIVNGSSGTPDADIDAPEAWDSTTGSRDVVVAVIDSGIAYNHPDLAANIWRNPGESGGGKDSNGIDDDGNGFVDDWRGWDFVSDDNAPRDLLGHGTHVAGTIGAVGNDGIGTTGVNWQVSLMPVRVLNAQGSGTSADVGAAINYAAANGADVINVSLGGEGFSAAVGSAIAAAASSLVAVAAGNDATNNDTSASYPCNYASANIVCVGATDQADGLAGYSNHGVVNVDLAAPGSLVLSTVPSFTNAMTEGFEGDISASWSTGGTGTQWSRGLDSIGYYAADSVSGSYLPSSDTWLRTTSAVNLGGLENCHMSYFFSLDTEANVDRLLIEGSTNGSTWTELGTWSGSTGGDWLTGTHDLSAFDGSSVFLRFRLTSNLLVSRDGASIDDVRVRCLSTSFTGDEFSYSSGTSMATPHVAGAAALLLSAAPTATVAIIRNALLTGVDPTNDLFGKVGTGGRLNLATSLDIVKSAGLPLPTASPSSSASASPSPSASPSGSPTGPQLPVVHDRTLTLRLRGHLRARGRVLESSSLPLCIADVEVRIKRNGKVIKRVRTDDEGRYSVALPDRGGRYKARITRSETAAIACGAALSPVRRHRD